jgi:glycosyltransferase involved in cell wall biosynthesis
LNRMRHLAFELQIKADFLGFQKDVGPWMDVADITVMPSHVEPLGNVAIEAMGHGCPVIGSAVGGIPETVVDGQTGILIPPKQPEILAENLEGLLIDANRRSLMAVKARERIKAHFSMDACIKNVENLYTLLKDSRHYSVSSTAPDNRVG